MRGTYRIQRLKQPYGNDWQRKVGHAFGGESKIQMKQEGFEVLKGLFSFDYMGAGEYEFGAIPAALHDLVQDEKDLVSFTLVLEPKEIKPNWMRQSMHDDARRKVLREAREKGVRPPRAKKLVPDISARTVYGLCRSQHQFRVIELIREMAAGKLHTKNGHRFDAAMDPMSDIQREIVGWFEIDNGWFVFSDEEMWKKTCALFMGKTEETKNEVPDAV